MCTALSFSPFFGRNLDLHQSYGEEVCLIGRGFPFPFGASQSPKRHHAIIGMATVRDGIPLYYDAMNEHGIAMAGLNFPGNAVYHPLADEKENIAPFALIPFVLAKCKNLKEVKALLGKVNIADMGFSPSLPPTPLHWMIATPEGDLVVESTKDGVGIFENKVGVLANNPPFGLQMEHSSGQPTFTCLSPAPKILSPSPHNFHSLGLGAVGLPGDYSSMSRFVRGCFLRQHADHTLEGQKAVEQFFHLLSALAVPKGCVKTPEGEDHYTLYSSAMDLCQKVYYYRTYFCSRITAVRLLEVDLEKNHLIRLPLKTDDGIFVSLGHT